MTHLLDQQLAAGLRGDFVEGWRLAQLLPKDDPRATFNRGWYLLQQGKLLEGHKMLDAGRGINVFGNRHIGSTQPIWDGKSKGTVLLNLEGGLGDQICGVRWAKEITKRGNNCVISCSSEIASLFVDVEGVSAIIQHEACNGIYHDYWLPSMSAVVALGYDYEDLRGDAYITNYTPQAKRLGVRWCGNPTFEHEQHRLFPAQIMFDTVEGYDCVSLQRDEGVELKPVWMKETFLETWKDTLISLSFCSLVITSCTSVAHLSGAMGIPTWIIVPILPYYLWALPGEKTFYYDSVTLFRQTTYGDWTEPFDKIRSRLKEEL